MAVGRRSFISYFVYYKKIIYTGKAVFVGPEFDLTLDHSRNINFFVVDPPMVLTLVYQTAQCHIVDKIKFVDHSEC